MQKNLSSLILSICLNAIEVYVFDASALVDVLLFYEVVMKKKISNEEIAQAINTMAETVRSDLDYNFRVAQSQMQIAENDLADTLNENQKKLYEEFIKKRDEFYAIASELYKRSF